METNSMNDEAGSLIDSSFEEFNADPLLQKSLAEVTFDALVQQRNGVVLVDRTSGRREMKGDMLLALSLGLARRLSAEISEERVGIVLPSGLGGTIANLACVFAGKIPVNLNFTLGPGGVKACLRKSGVKTIITAQQAREKIDSKIPDFPWTDSILDIREALIALPKVKTLSYLALIHLVPEDALARLLKIPTIGGDKEAALLFTSGSDGDPKGVVLTHRNVLANVMQVEGCGALMPGGVLMANLPIFHSFGFTVSIWCAIYSAVKMVTLPSPLEFQRIASVIEEEDVSIMLATPTFLRPYLSRVAAEQLETVRIVITGAEKTPEGFREAWEAKFTNSHYLEGYGLTETTPVASVNVPNRRGRETTRKGSVGKLLRGMQGRIRCSDTGKLLSPYETGILLLRGANVFRGYLDDEKRTAEVLEQDWFVTGDLARFDSDGFLFIEGRLSRFSKIGGEMAPHGTIETTIAKAFGLEGSEVQQLAVSAKADSVKGEALVLLTTFAIEVAELREKLAESGLPNLWIPKVIRQVEAIPVLASGKLDLKGLKKLAEE